MIFALALTMSLAASPLQPSMYEAHLSPRQGLLVESLQVRGPQLVSGIKNVVAGSILGVLGGASLTGGVFALVSSINQSGSDQTVSQVLGWTFFGVGALLLVIGLPLLIVGIVQIATSPHPKRVSMGVSRNGNLAVFF